MKTENPKIKIYVDSGGDISKLKKTAPTYCEFYQFPYDSPDRPKKIFLLAKPSDAEVRDGHLGLNEYSEKTLNDFEGSSFYSEITSVIGKAPQNRRDILHLDSAYKTGCKAFLTSDKRDFWLKRKELEALTGIKILHNSQELEEILQIIKALYISNL